MSATLICVSGPLQHSAFAVEEGIAIGRDSTNRICISDNSLSRQHCVIVHEQDRYVVRDLNSHNGTHLNGTRVSEHELENGDHLRIGSSIFQITIDGAAMPRTAGISFDDSSFPAESIAAYSPEGRCAAQLSKERLAHDFGALLTIAARLSGIRNSESLLWQLTGVLMALLPGERVAVLTGESGSVLNPAFAWDRESGPGRPVHVSRTVVDRVLAEKQALLVNNVPQHLPVSSMKALEIYSVLCVPMCTPDKQLGVIYVDTRQLGSMFDSGHLHLLSAIATISALALENVRSIESLEQENQQLKAQIRSPFELIGDSGPMQEIYRFISKVSRTDSSVMIYGESGTGKELVACAIHRNSQRANKPLVAVNCAAITESLLESELFGYEKGAFTGATAQKRGLLESATGGTIFLDEIGELALPMQAKLLRVLQEREVVRVGGTRPTKVDLRVLAATNKPLAQSVKAGQFREDLFYRLEVVSCRIPPLRERREDIKVLALHFARKYAEKCKRKITGVSNDALACLTHYDWPGNVRELENAIERAVVLGSTELVLRDDLPESITEVAAPESTSGYHVEVARRKRELILEALRRANHSFTDAATILGIHPNYLHRLVRVLDLRSQLKKPMAS